MCKLAKRCEELGRRGIAMKSAAKKKEGSQRGSRRGEIEERHRWEMVGLDSQLQTRPSIERRIIPRSRLSWPVFEVKAIEARRNIRNVCCVYPVFAGRASGISGIRFTLRVYSYYSCKIEHCHETFIIAIWSPFAELFLRLCSVM